MREFGEERTVKVIQMIVLLIELFEVKINQGS